MGNNAMLPSKH